MFDQGVVHEWIRNKYFGGDQRVWIYNGAACWTSDKTVTYSCRVRDNTGFSRVFVQLFDANWKPRSIPVPLKLAVGIKPSGGLGDVGPQDARVFEFRGKPWIIFNMLRSSKEGVIRQMHVHNIHSGFSLPIPLSIKNSSPRPVEKNWTPFVRGGVLHFIYSFCPLVILAVPDIHLIDTKIQPEAECIVVFAERSPIDSQMRGGTPAIETSSGVFEGFLHSTRPLSPAEKFDPLELPAPARLTNCFYRTHRFKLIFDASLAPQAKVLIGPEMSFFGKQIELVYGWDGMSTVIINVNDKTTIIANLSELKN